MADLDDKLKALGKELQETEAAIGRQQQVLNGLLELRQRQLGAITVIKELQEPASDSKAA